MALAAVLLAAVAALLLAPPPAGVAATVPRAAALVVLAVGLWSTGMLPEYLAVLLFFLLAVVLGVAPPDVVFAGFHSTAVWLVFGGLIIGIGVQRSGLGARAVDLAVARFRGGYLRLALSLALICVAVSFLVPSAMGRVVLLVPLVAALADRVGFAPESRGRVGLIAVTALATTMPAFAILPSNVPNMALIGAAESIHGVHFRYGDYLLLNFPVLGAGSALVAPLLATLLFAQPVRPLPAAAARPWSRDERALLAVMLVTVALWATDFAHGLSPAWVALAAAIVCLAPGIGVMPPSAIREINVAPWFFVAGVIGLGAVASHSGLADAIGRWLAGVVDLAGAAGWRTFATLVGMNMTVSLVAAHPAAPAILTPIAGTLASSSGWPLESVLMTQVCAWVVCLFPYQVPPVLVALTVGGVPVARAMPLMALYFAIGVAALLPLHFLWGHAIGVFP